MNHLRKEAIPISHCPIALATPSTQQRSPPGTEPSEYLVVGIEYHNHSALTCTSSFDLKRWDFAKQTVKADQLGLSLDEHRSKGTNDEHLLLL